MSRKTISFFVSLSLALSFLTGAAFAGSPTIRGAKGDFGRTIGLSISPIQMLFGAHTLKLEYKMNDILAFVAQVGVINTDWTIKPGFNNHPGTFFEAGLGARFYVTGCPLSYGLYVETLSFAEYGFTPGHVAITEPFPAGPDMWIVGTSFALGYEYLTDLGVFVDFYGNLTGYVGWNFPNSSPGGTDAATYNLNIWRPTVGGRLGYAW